MQDKMECDWFKPSKHDVIHLRWFKPFDFENREKVATKIMREMHSGMDSKWKNTDINKLNWRKVKNGDFLQFYQNCKTYLFFCKIYCKFHFRKPFLPILSQTSRYLHFLNMWWKRFFIKNVPSLQFLLFYPSLTPCVFFPFATFCAVQAHLPINKSITFLRIYGIGSQHLTTGSRHLNRKLELQ